MDADKRTPIPDRLIEIPKYIDGDFYAKEDPDCEVCIIGNLIKQIEPKLFEVLLKCDTLEEQKVYVDAFWEKYFPDQDRSFEETLSEITNYEFRRKYMMEICDRLGLKYDKDS